MNNMHIFIIRALMGSVFGVILSKFFFPKAPVVVIVCLCVVLVGLAYFSEYLRKRKQDHAARTGLSSQKGKKVS
ncbi:MAG: hypothetical protein GY874_05565 [Desulfobacteraceae bacterium]|nr:hypothetical protein [Desulfobacteraceae bacterium]